MIKQQDLVNQVQFDDAVSFGGWAVDLHPSDGVYDSKPGCTQYHSKGIYQIPLRTMISTNISNLFLGGRIISATHVAFGSTRVMATTALSGQAVGYGAAQCIKNKILPAQLLEQKQIKELQQTLSLNGQSIPGIAIEQKDNLVASSTISTSTNFKLDSLKPNGDWFNLSTGVAQLLPLEANTKYNYTFSFAAEKATKVQVELRICENTGHYTPDVILENKTIELVEGEQEITFSFDTVLSKKQYAFITFLSNDLVSIRRTEQRLTGLVSVYNGVNKAVNNNGKQTPPDNIGIDAFEFWIPQRRPNGQNLALSISPALELYSEENVCNGFVRPYLETNAWAAELTDSQPQLTLEWDEAKEINSIKLFFDTDYDHAMESSLMGHPESVMPFCAKSYKISDQNGTVVYETKSNHQTINTIVLPESIKTNKLTIEFEPSSTEIPVSVFEIFIA